MIEKEFYECQRCLWKWTNRKEGKPRRCPNQKCKSMRWEHPIEDGETRLKYPVDHLAVGDIINFPFSRDQKANSNRVAAINAWGKRHGREFYISTIILEKQYHHRVKRVI